MPTFRRATQCTFSISPFPLKCRGTIILNQLLGLLLSKLLLCAVQDNFSYKNSSCTLTNLLLVSAYSYIVITCWSAAPAIYLEMLDKIQRRVYGVIGPDLASWHQSFSHQRDVISLDLFFFFFINNFMANGLMSFHSWCRDCLKFSIVLNWKVSHLFYCSNNWI